MGFWGSLARGALGVGTAGVSEGVLAGVDAVNGNSIGTAGSDMAGGVDKAAGTATDDFTNVGANRFTPTPYGGPGVDLPGAAQDQRYGRGLAGTMMNAGAQGFDNGQTAFGQFMKGPGQYQQNQQLADQEAQSRGYDQAGALQLQREAAMGQSPSAAAYQMQAGLDQSLANQQAQAGGARGAAGLALAGSNAMANSANMQNQAFTNASALRAQEMAGARGAYGDLSSQVRQQDQGLIGQADTVGMANANNRTSYASNAGGVGAQYGNVGIGAGNSANGFYGNSQNMPTSLYNGQVTQRGQDVNSYGNAQDNYAKITTANATAKAGQTDKLLDAGLGLVSKGGTALGAGIGKT